mmetsp:Transcript_19899/g.29454  ORF Transcript_19899/g.29454 Transcript_19899/m.29454 type:complete len:112 (+) Transcript_19899:355-690(+)
MDLQQRRLITKPLSLWNSNSKNRLPGNSDSDGHGQAFCEGTAMTMATSLSIYRHLQFCAALPLAIWCTRLTLHSSRPSSCEPDIEAPRALNQLFEGPVLVRSNKHSRCDEG